MCAMRGRGRAVGHGRRVASRVSRRRERTYLGYSLLRLGRAALRVGEGRRVRPDGLARDCWRSRRWRGCRREDSARTRHNFDFHTGCLKAVRASTPGSSPSAASAGSSRSSSSARRPRSSSGPRPSRSRASTATTTARSTPASGCSERNSDHIPSTGYVIRHLSPRAGHQGIDRTRPGHQGRPAARARLHMYISSLSPTLRARPAYLSFRNLPASSRRWQVRRPGPGY